jgi:hypothetical protein
MMHSNKNDLDTTTSMTADKEVESGATTEVIAERVTPGVESESVNMFMIGFKWYNCKKSEVLGTDFLKNQMETRHLFLAAAFSLAPFQTSEHTASAG